MSMVSDAAQNLLNCFEAELLEAPNPPANICLRVGAEVPYDAGLSQDECCEGLAWVRIARIYPTNSRFPDQDNEPHDCVTTSWGVDLEMGAARCKPFGDLQRGPSCDEWTALALQIDEDAAAMRRALCCFLPMVFSENLLPVEWVPVATDGGCAGGTMMVTVQVDCLEC